MARVCEVCWAAPASPSRAIAGRLRRLWITPEEEEGNNDENQHGENWSTDKPTEESRKWRKSVGLMTKNAEGNLVVRKDMEKMVLSDDDIEDDD